MTSLYSFPAGKTEATYTIPETIKTIGWSSFNGCNNLTYITIPEYVTLVDGYAFALCKNLKYVDIVDGVTNVSVFAFAYCDNLTSLTIPNSTTNIAPNAFTGSTKVTIYGNAGSYADEFAYKYDIPFSTSPAPVPASYTVTVTNGTGSGDYLDGSIVTVTANAAPSGKRFKEWTTTPAVTFVNNTTETSATAQFTMPEEAVTVTAVYEDTSDSYPMIITKGEDYYKVLTNPLSGGIVTTAYGIEYDGWIYCAEVFTSYSSSGNFDIYDEKISRFGLKAIAKVRTDGTEYTTIRRFDLTGPSNYIFKRDGITYFDVKDGYFYMALSVYDETESKWVTERCKMKLDGTGEELIGGDTEEPAKYMVTFESNGGTAVSSATVSSLTTSPKTTRSGYSFGGWYSDSSLTNKITFPYTLTADITLYAKWTKATSSGGGSSGGGSTAATTTTGSVSASDSTKISSAKQGETVKLDSANIDKLDASNITSIKNNKLTAVIDAGDAMMTITADGIKNITGDLDVKTTVSTTTKRAISAPATTVDNIKSSLLAKELKVGTGTVTQNYTAEVELNMGESNANESAFVLKWDENTKDFVFVSANKINADGTTQAVISGTGEYVVIAAKKGNVSKDGKLSAKDATLILKSLIGTVTFDPLQNALANPETGKPTSANVTQILKYLVGLVDSL